MIINKRYLNKNQSKNGKYENLCSVTRKIIYENFKISLIYKFPLNTVTALNTALIMIKKSFKLILMINKIEKQLAFLENFNCH